MNTLLVFLTFLINPYSPSRVYGIKANSSFLHATILPYDYRDFPEQYCYGGTIIFRRPQEFIRVRLESSSGFYRFGDTITLQIKPECHEPEIGKQYIIQVYSTSNHQTISLSNLTAHQFSLIHQLLPRESRFLKLHERL